MSSIFDTVPETFAIHAMLQTVILVMNKFITGSAYLVKTKALATKKGLLHERQKKVEDE